MTRTVTPTKGNTTTAIRARTHSRRIMTPRSATIVKTWRIAMTITVEESRARRLTSLVMRDMSSAEWRSVKKESGMPWMWA